MTFPSNEDLLHTQRKDSLKEPFRIERQFKICNVGKAQQCLLNADMVEETRTKFYLTPFSAKMARRFLATLLRIQFVSRVSLMENPGK